MPPRIHQFLLLLRGNETFACNEDSACPIVREIFTSGNCRNLAHMLMMVEPGGKPICLTLEDGAVHVVYQLNGRWYDVDGDVTEKYSDAVIGSERDVDLNVYSWEDRGPSY